MEKILKVICENYRVSKIDLFSKKRNLQIVKARQMLIYFLHNFYKKNISETAKLTNRNHATIIYTLNKIESEIKIYKDKIKEIENILNDLNSYLIPNEIDLLKMCKNYTNSFI